MDSQQQGHSREILLRTDWNRCLLCHEETSGVQPNPNALMLELDWVTLPFLQVSSASVS